MRLIQLFLAALAALHCAHGFVVHRTSIAAGWTQPSSVARGSRAATTTMCVPKEVAAAILVAGAGYLFTQGVPPAKAADMISMSSTPTTCECSSCLGLLLSDICMLRAVCHFCTLHLNFMMKRRKGGATAAAVSCSCCVCDRIAHTMLERGLLCGQKPSRWLGISSVCENI